MKRHELRELHYITPICNIRSILQNGILSHARAARLPHQSVAMPVIQARRKNVCVPGGRRLHEYANLYICARNPMLYRLRHQHTSICVLAVSTAVLDLPQVVVSDSNASSDYARFAPAPDGLTIVDRDLVFADDWRHPEQIEYWRRKAAKCAEVLVPDRVEPRFISEAYVSCELAQQTVAALGVNLRVTVNRHLFFV
jgi:hypothetical protein